MKADKASELALPNRFARSFLEAQVISSRRSRYTNVWPLWEFWGNKVDEHIKVMDEFIAPLLQEALENKVEGLDVKVDDEVGEDTTLLEHLVRLTDGLLIRSIPRRSPRRLLFFRSSNHPR